MEGKIPINPTCLNDVLHVEQYVHEMLSMGRLDELIKSLNDEIERYSKLDDQRMKACYLQNLGSIHFLSGDYEKALTSMNDAIDTYQKIRGGNDSVRAAHGHCLCQLGSLYNTLGKWDKANEHLEKGIEMLLMSRNKDLLKQDFLAQAYGDQGEYFLQKELYDRAIGRFEDALEICKKTGNKMEEARSLAYKGATYLRMSMFDKCIEDCEKSLRIYTQVGNKVGASLCHSTLANCYGALGKVDISEHHFNMSIKMSIDSKQFNDAAIAWGNRGEKYENISLLTFFFGDATESLKTCVKCFKEAIENNDKLLANLSDDSNKTAFVDRYYSWYDRLTRPFNLLGRSSASLLFLDLGRAKILRDLVYKQVKNQGQDNHQPSYLSSWLTIENGKEKERIFDLCQEIQLLESNSTLLFYNFNHAKILTIWVLQADGCVFLKTSDPTVFLIPSEIELECHINNVFEKASGKIPRGYSFFKQLTEINFEDAHAKESTSSEFPNGKEAEKSTCYDREKVKVESENRAPGIVKPPPEECDKLTRPSRSHLYQALIEPVKNLIEKTKKLIIVPQRCIFFAPFSSFIDENGCLLSERYQIQIIPSVHVLAASMQASKSNKIGGSLLVDGNPGRKNNGLSAIPLATEEVKYLASLLGAQPLTWSRATKKNVMDLMPAASIIHIAAHGHEETGDIFLAPESSNPTSSSSSRLTQSDVLKCKLSARLVVLSCCYTARGKLSSEGVLGIARSFLGAGASSVLVTLWNISDLFTIEFMKVFYKKILEEKSACLALKETMNMFQSSQRYSAFLYWSAFEILGEDVRFTASEIEQIRQNSR